MRKIYVLLTRHHDIGSKFISLFSGSCYSHASIGLEEDMNTFYSFVVKGFIVEQITRYIKRGKKLHWCCLYELDVTDEVYENVKQMLAGFIKNKPLMHYTKLGVVLSMFRIPYKRKNHYFCSQFVAEVIAKCRVLKLGKSASLYLPGDFSSVDELRIKFSGNIMEFAEQFLPKPAFS